MADKLDPQLLAQILGLQSTQRAVDNGTSGAYWYDPRFTTDDPNGWILNQQYGYDFAQGDGGENQRNTSKDSTRILKLRPDTEGKLGDQWDAQGNYLGTYQAADGGGRDLNTAIALIAGGYFGGNALAGANAGGTAGLTGVDAAMADAAASGSLTGGSFGGAAGGVDLVAGSGLGADVGSLTGGSALTTGGAAGGSSMLGSAGSALSSLGLNGSTLGGLAGAVASAIDSKDKTQTSSRDPWAPAQDFLKQRLADGGELAAQYKAQPFSPAQQTAYGNVGGLVDLVNSQLPGLLAGMNANASGQNQFVRGQRPTLTGATFNPAAFQPAGLLGYMGSK